MRFAIADLLALPAARLPPFQLISAVGVLHHVPRESIQRALCHLSDSLVPGGVLQLATYSTIGIHSWWAPARRLVHQIAPSLVNANGELLRQPAPYELRELRASLMTLGSNNSHGSTSGGAAKGLSLIHI